MFEPLGRRESERSTGTGRDMRVILVFVLLCAAALVAIVIV